MLQLAIAFFVIALISALLGFGNMASASASVAQILFFFFVVAFIVSLVAHLFRRNRFD